MPIRDMAKILARAGRPFPSRRIAEREAKQPPVQPVQPVKPRGNALHTVPEGEQRDPQSVYSIPDSWTAPRVSPPEAAPPEPVEERKRSGPPLKPQHKKRKNAMSFSVSEEEEFYIRQYASQKGLNLSDFVRTTLFKAMGRKVPDRPGQEGA